MYLLIVEDNLLGLLPCLPEFLLLLQRLTPKAILRPLNDPLVVLTVVGPKFCQHGPLAQ